MTTYTVYKEIKNGKSKVNITSADVEALRGLLKDSTIEIIYSSTNRHYAFKTYERELKEESIKNDKERERFHKLRMHAKQMGTEYGKENGKKVGAYSRDSGHLQRLRMTKVICPDGHRSNLQYYKVYCNNRGLDHRKAKILPYNGS